MIRRILFKDIGPFNSGSVDGYNYVFNKGDPVNISGYGKTFVLNSIWWALTGSFLAKINYKVMTGHVNTPLKGQKDPVITYTFSTSAVDVSKEKVFVRRDQVWKTWKESCNTDTNYSSMVVSVLEDGGFALYDPLRNSRKNSLTPAYVFTESELLNGLSHNQTTACNGLIRDVAGWQAENGEPFKQFSKVLSLLSKDGEYKIQLGNQTRVSLNDIRDMPTIRMPDGLDVPVTFLPYGIRRMVELAYLLVWGADENARIAALLGVKPDISNLVLLVDNLDSNLGDVLRENIVQKLGSILTYITGGSQFQMLFSSSSCDLANGIAQQFRI
jgi:hypothetical protein